MGPSSNSKSTLLQGKAAWTEEKLSQTMGVVKLGAHLARQAFCWFLCVVSLLANPSINQSYPDPLKPFLLCHIFNSSLDEDITEPESPFFSVSSSLMWMAPHLSLVLLDPSSLSLCRWRLALELRISLQIWAWLAQVVLFGKEAELCSECEVCLGYIVSLRPAGVIR